MKIGHPKPKSGSFEEKTDNSEGALLVDGSKFIM